MRGGEVLVTTGGHCRIQEISRSGEYSSTVLGGEGGVPHHCVEKGTWFRADLMVQTDIWCPC